MIIRVGCLLFGRLLGRIPVTLTTFRCAVIRCETCAALNISHKIKSSVTSVNYEMVNQNGEHLNGRI